jgi:hypothetical protein
MSSDLYLLGCVFRDLIEVLCKGEFGKRQEFINAIVKFAVLCGVKQLHFDYTNFGKALAGDPTCSVYFGNVDTPEKFLWVLLTMMVGNLDHRNPRSVLPSLQALEYFVQRIPIYIASERGKMYLFIASQTIMETLEIPWNTPDFIRNARGEILSQLYPERVTEKNERVLTDKLKSTTSTPKSRMKKFKNTLIGMEQDSAE